MSEARSVSLVSNRRVTATRAPSTLDAGALSPEGLQDSISSWIWEAQLVCGDAGERTVGRKALHFRHRVSAGTKAPAVKASYARSGSLLVLK